LGANIAAGDRFYTGLQDPRLGAPLDGDIEALRRQQADFARERERLDIQNSWLAIPALAPAAVAAGLEAAALLAPQAILRAGPLALSGKVALPRGGETFFTMVGRNAHRYLDDIGSAKRDWVMNQLRTGKSGARIKPDAVNERRRYVVELKPNTASGRAAGARQLKRYGDETGFKPRLKLYDPYDPRWR
jgi:hypothetical protein